MSYPKRPIGESARMNERMQQKNNKREQLKNIIINKFRSKYNVQAEVDDFDNVIKRNVNDFIENEQMSEANLAKLDKKLAALASEIKGIPVQMTRKNNGVRQS